MHKLEKRFTDDARKVMRTAENESAVLEHGFVGTEHVLLGLVADEILRQEFFQDKEVTREAVISQLAQLRPPKPWEHSDWQPQTPRVKKLYEYTLEESRERHDEYVCPDYLLLAILRIPDCYGFRVLEGLGINSKSLGDEVLGKVGPWLD